MGFADPDDLSCYDAIFTDEEFDDLIKYIKTLPDGEWQAKVAEHGKTEVKSEDDEEKIESSKKCRIERKND